MDLRRHQQLTRATRVLLAGALLALHFSACSSPIDSTAADASTGGGGAGTGGTGGTGGSDASSGGVGGGSTGGWGGYAFGHCDVTTPSSCSLEQTCKQLGCGEDWSFLDAEGCVRPFCLADEDCASEERCVLPHMRRPGCYPSEWSCGFEDDSPGVCRCDGQTADCQRGPVCVPIAIAPDQSDCDYALHATGCALLVESVSAIESWLAGGTVTGAAKDAMQACYDKLKPELAKLGCE